MRNNTEQSSENQVELYTIGISAIITSQINEPVSFDFEV
jgi:hypothetical protein